MKKVILIFLVMMGLGFGSCDMDLNPYNKIPTDESLQSVSDFKNFRNGFYAYARGLFTGGYVIQPEIQADGLNAVIDYSNTYGGWYRWQFTAEDGNQWANFYYLISNCNLVLEKGYALMHNFSATEQAELKQYLGEAYFMRALAYEELAVRFSKAYTQCDPAQELGVSLVTKYVPSSNASTYPARSTLAETYKMITSDLDSAARYLTTPGKQNSGYATKDAVAALKARVALQMGNYAGAIAAAKPLVDGGAYPLVVDATGMNNMWAKDESTETIFQPIFKPGQMGNETGGILVDKSLGATKINPDFIPTKTVLDLYDKENDLRFGVYFKEASMTFSSGKVDLYYCSKWPGHADWNRNPSTSFMNMPKVLRIAEMYLILAEAYNESGDAGNALVYLNALKSKRIIGYTNEAYSGTALTKEIQNERQRELYMEGYRLWDLKRYGEGISGRVPQDGTYVYLDGNSNTTNLSKAAADFRFVWPIPAHETNVNPQMDQNDGYTNE